MSILDILSMISYLGIMIYIIISSVKSGKQGLALYKHIIVRISIFAVPLAVVTIIDIVSNMNLNQLSISTGEGGQDIDKVIWLFFGIPAMIFNGALNAISVVFAAIAVFLIFGSAIGALWIIYAIAKSAGKKNEKPAETDTIVDISGEINENN